tara:strand:+ start:871 stop:1875 length:1005 start_codon:yes stop_codon:yes gene_type:complete
MELIGFIVLLVLGIAAIIFDRIEIIKYLYIPLLFSFMVIVRLNAFVFNAFEIDIITYGLEMKAYSFDIYYLREFVFWFGIRILYFITQSELVAFLLLDILWIYLIYKVSRKVSVNKIGNTLLIILATCFPFFFGYQNIYRQFFATIVLLYSYSIIDDRSNRSIFLFFVSIFIHNLSLLILPLFIIKKFFTFKLNDRLVLSSVLVAIYLLFLPSILSLKDGDDPTKIDLSILYMILFIFLFLFYIYKFRANILNFILIVPSLIPATLLTIGFVAYRQEMIAERLGMMFIPFIIFDIYNYSLLIQTSFKRKLLQLFLLLLLSVPVLLFTSSLMFLD